MPLNRRSLFLTPVATLPFHGSAASPSDLSQMLARGTVNPRLFGAICDGISDDSVAVQRAINACLAEKLPKSLLLDGPCRIHTPIFIDRPVDRTEGIFRIFGGGSGRLISAGNFPLFDSNLKAVSGPSSEHIWFDQVAFESPSDASHSTVMTDKFLRIQFHGCEFDRIRALSGTIYAQEWKFSRCVARRWPDAFFSSKGGYHVTSSGSKYQNGSGTVFRVIDESLQEAGCVGCSFHQDVVEANTGSFLRAAIVQGLSIAGLYSEGNYGPTIDIDTRAPNKGVSITGCMFAPQEANKADENFFDIRWGRIEGGHAGGNYSTGRLHHHRAASLSGLAIAGDYAALQLSRHAN